VAEVLSIHHKTCLEPSDLLGGPILERQLCAERVVQDVVGRHLEPRCFLLLLLCLLNEARENGARLRTGSFLVVLSLAHSRSLRATRGAPVGQRTELKVGVEDLLRRVKFFFVIFAEVVVEIAE